MRPTPKDGRAQIQLGHVFLYPAPPNDFWSEVGMGASWSGDCRRCGASFDSVTFKDADAFASTHVCDPSQRAARVAALAFHDAPPRPGYP